VSMRVAVVGGTGQIGSAVIDALTEAGNDAVQISRTAAPTSTAA
jgi:uncharacterized protein YbjT (DUF2867 family)